MYRPTIVYNDPNEERKDSFVKYIAHRVMNNNKNFLCAVTGPTGAGKSWLTGSIGEKISKITGVPFNAKEHTIFSLKELLDLINDKDVATKLPPGSFLHFDEPQVSTNSRDWQSESNKILNTLTSTFRNMRLIIFFATPYLEFIDKQSRILFHSEIEVKSYDKTTNLTLCKPRLLEWNGRQQDFYRKRLVIRYNDPKKSVFSWYYLQEWEVNKPSKAWIDTYEAMKLRFTQKLNRELHQQYMYSQAVANKGQDLVTLGELYKVHGLDYGLFSKELPHLTPYMLERLVAMIKKQEKSQKEKISLENAVKQPKTAKKGIIQPL